MRTEHKAFRMEVADTASERAYGLSDRNELTADEGMLFVFNDYQQQCMWMKDMNFDLDIIWLDASKTIKHIEQDLSPQTYPASYCGSGPAAYVIEVNSAVAEKTHLKLGDKLRF